MNSGPKLNMKCEIIYEGRTYKSSVQDVTEDYVGVSIPVRRGEYIALTINELVDVIYYEEKQVYKFHSKVVGRKRDGIPMILLAPPSDILKVQRREFFRIDLTENIKYLKVDNEITEEQFDLLIKDSEKYDDAILLDLSAGGIKINTKNELKNGDKIIVQMPLLQEKISVLCQCVRSYKDLNTKFYTCGIAFTDIDKQIREKLINHVFKLMRKLRTK